MSNIELFQSAFAVNFPVEIAEMVLTRLEDIYGSEFQKTYGHLSNEKLRNLTCTVLNGLTPIELQRGLNRMNSEKWCPKLPEFRSWCVQAGDWWTAEQAWAKALNFSNDPEFKITTLAKRCLDEVQYILANQSQRAAHKAFVDIYQDYLVQAQKAGRVQVMWIPKKTIAEPKARNHKGVPCPADLLAQVSGVNKYKTSTMST